MVDSRIVSIRSEENEISIKIEIAVSNSSSTGFKSWQTLFGSIIAFLGVSITIISAWSWNVHIQRAQRCNEENGVRAALWSEVKSADAGNVNLAKDARSSLDDESKAVFFSLNYNDYIYKSLVNKMYILSPLEITSLSGFHEIQGKLVDNLKSMFPQTMPNTIVFKSKKDKLLLADTIDDIHKAAEYVVRDLESAAEHSGCDHFGGSS